MGSGGHDGVRLSRIRLYPVKALDGVDVPSARLLPSGSLEHDREFAILDGQGRPVNGKRCADVHRLRAGVHFGTGRIAFRPEGAAAEVRYDLEDAGGIEAWLGRFFGFPVTWHREAGGLPDDEEAHGPTVVSDATLAAVAAWFPPLTGEDALLRFRPNLVLTGCDPFWEDRLYGPEGAVVPFAIGEAELQGTNPCRRCVVPTRDPAGGGPYPGFRDAFTARRFETLPSWAERSRFADTSYRLCVNTSADAAQADKEVRVGDAVTVLRESGRIMP